MKVLNCFINIKNPETKTSISFNYVNEIEIVTSTRNFTDTAKVIVPRKLKYKGKSITDYVKRNSTISISLGYGTDFYFETVFKGYVKTVSSGTPTVIECENEAWKLKQVKLPATYYPKLKIGDFVKEWMPSYNTSIAEVDLGEVKITRDTTLAKVFEYFMTNYPVNFYFRDDKFYGILPTTLTTEDNATRTIKFRIGENTISDNLVYTLAEDQNLQIIVKTVTRDNQKLEWKEPQDVQDAEIRTFLVPGKETVEQLKAFAKDQLAKFKVDKMAGDFMAFGEPYVRKGDIVHILDDDNKERHDKKFFVDAVTYTFGQGGYRQKITLGGQIK